MEIPTQSNQLDMIPKILQYCPRDSTGMYEIADTHFDLLERYLQNTHLIQPEPDPSQLRSGITLACKLQEAHTVGDRLHSFKFISESQCKQLVGGVNPVNLWLEQPLYADPDKILGAVSFGSWMGRGQYGQGEVDIRERPGKRSSFDQIVDYATRESQLPYLSNDGGLNLIVTKENTFFFSSNSHRAAAAKLRQEPLGFRRLSIYEIRT